MARLMRDESASGMPLQGGGVGVYVARGGHTGIGSYGATPSRTRTRSSPTAVKAILPITIRAMTHFSLNRTRGAVPGITAMCSMTRAAVWESMLDGKAPSTTLSSAANGRPHPQGPTCTRAAFPQTKPAAKTQRSLGTGMPFLCSCESVLQSAATSAWCGKHSFPLIGKSRISSGTNQLGFRSQGSWRHPNLSPTPMPPKRWSAGNRSDR